MHQAHFCLSLLTGIFIFHISYFISLVSTHYQNLLVSLTPRSGPLRSCLYFHPLALNTNSANNTQRKSDYRNVNSTLCGLSLLPIIGLSHSDYFKSSTIYLKRFFCLSLFLFLSSFSCYLQSHHLWQIIPSYLKGEMYICFFTN